MKTDDDLPGSRPPAARSGGTFVYIFACPDGALYVGSAKDVSRRASLHQAGRGAKFTHDHPEGKLVYVEGPFDLAEAIRRERQLKGWSRAKKIALIAGNVTALRAFSRPREQCRSSTNLLHHTS
jgi:putative endonuclease